MNQETIEVRIWAYIEKCDTEAEHIETGQWIQSSASWKALYNDALLVHQSLDALSTSQPSMRFTRNVMEAIRAAQPAKSKRSYLNPWILRGIAAVFALLFIVMLIVGISSSSWSDGKSIIADGSLSGARLGSQSVSPTVWPFLIMVDILAALVLADAIHHRRQKLAGLKEL